MQAVDLPCNPSLDLRASDLFAMSEGSSPIHSPNRHSSQSPEKEKASVGNNAESESIKENDVKNAEDNGSGSSSVVVGRRERLSRACTQRAAARLQAAAEAEAAMAEKERKRKKSRRRERLTARLLREESDEDEGSREEEEENGEDENGEEDGSSKVQYSRIVTPLVGEPEASQLPRWKIRSMWQLASILNFLNVFRHSLNIKVEFSAEEFETALITPNNTLADIHMPLLKAIPPITRMALGRHTWITVLCRKLRDWWHWVAEGDLPIVASHGTEVEKYHALDPGVRVVILKALCDIRVEQEDIRNYIDDSIKQGVHLSAFRKERIGGDSYGVSYWYEDDSIIGHRLYREIRKVEVKNGKGRNIPPIPDSSYKWEAVATNLDEFLTVSDKLFSSKYRTEVSVGKKLKNNMLPEIERVHKRKEKLLKKQHRQALMLDSMISMDRLAAGRSLRDRKPVTYTFDDFDRSINEAIKVTKKKQSSPEPLDHRDPVKPEASDNGKWGGPSQCSEPPSSNEMSPKLPEDNEFHEDKKTEPLDLDRSNRRRQRPQRYSEKEFVEELSDNNADFDSDDDIVGEVVYHDEYIESRKRRKKMSSTSEEEYLWDGENPDEEDGEDEMLSTSEDSDRPRRFRMLPGRPRREMKVRSVDELQLGLRRSKRTTRNRINYRKYEMSGSDTEKKPQKSKAIARHSGVGNNTEFSADNKINTPFDLYIEEQQPRTVDVDENQTDPPDETNPDEDDSIGKRRYLDLNELAPVSGVDDAPNSAREEDRDRDRNDL